MLWEADERLRVHLGADGRLQGVSGEQIGVPGGAEPQIVDLAAGLLSLFPDYIMERHHQTDGI